MCHQLTFESLFRLESQQSTLFRFNKVTFLPGEVRFCDQISDDCEEASETEGRAQQQHQDPQERHARVQERKVRKNV